MTLTPDRVSPRNLRFVGTPRLPLLAILLLAALLRLQNLHAIEHNVDHAYPIWQALSTLDRGAFPVTAQGTSVLFDNPALTGYLFIPFVALTRSPFGPYLFVIALNTLAVWFAYRAAVALLDERRALIAAFLLAINPWVIEYSRTTWVQALIPFFICLIFWLLVAVLLGTAGRPGRRLIAALTALTALTQTYLLAFLSLAPAGLLLVIFRRRIPIRGALIGGAVFVAATGVYGAGLLANREETLSRIRSFSAGEARLGGEALSHALRLVTGRDYPAARGIDAPLRDAVLRQGLSELAHGALVVALLAGIVAVGWSASRPLRGRVAGKDGSSMGSEGRATKLAFRGDPGAIILLIWFALPILLMSYVSRQIHPFYLLFTLPAGHILAAKGAGLLLRWRVGSAALAAAGIALTALFALNTMRYAEETLATPGAHGLSALPVGEGVRMMDALFSERFVSNPGIVFADVDEWTLNSFAGRLFPVDRDADVSKTVYIPAEAGFYLRFVPPSEVGALHMRFADPAPRSIGLADGSAILRFRISQSALAGEPWIGGRAIQSDAGITFIGYMPAESLTPGRTSAILTAWRIDALTPERSDYLFGPFVHVFDAGGKRVAIGDGAVTPGWAWRKGDVQIKTMPVSIPADAVGPFRLIFGQYDGVHQRNAIFTLPDGSLSSTIPAALAGQ